MIKKKNTRFAVVGCGHIGRRHIDRILKHPDADLAAVCDTDARMFEGIEGLEHVKQCVGLDALLAHRASFDVASVCTPSGLHKDMVVRLFEGGCHVLCEKPMALTVEDSSAMNRAAHKAGKKLFVVKQNRYNPPVAAVKDLIQSDRLGRLFMVSVNCFWNRNEAYFAKAPWRGSKSMDGGPLYTQFSHFIDLVYWFMGDVASVASGGGNYTHPSIEVEDAGTVLFEFEGGAVGSLNYTTSCYSRNMEGSITLFGEKGTVKIGGQYLNELEYEDLGDGGIAHEKRPPNSGTYGYYTGNMSKHYQVYDNVIRALRGEEEIMVDGLEGQKIVAIIEGIYRAMRTGEKVCLKTGSSTLVHAS